MAFSGIPLPKIVSDVPAGGGILSALNNIYEAQKNALANQYYGPTQQANINYKNALTSAVPSEINLRGAQAQQALSTASKTPSEIQLNESLAGLHGTQAQINALRIKAYQGVGQSAGGGFMPVGDNNAIKQVPSPNNNVNMVMNGGGGVGVNPQTVNALTAPLNHQQPGGSVVVPGANNPANPAQQQNNVDPDAQYGISPYKPTQQDMNNQLMHIDTISGKVKNINDQIMDQYHNYAAKIKEASDQSLAANHSNQLLNLYNQAMDHVDFKGPAAGIIPSEKSYISSLFGAAGLNLSPEQLADRLASQLLPSSIQNLKSAMGAGKFSNLDVGIAQALKVDRNLSDANRAQLVALFQALNNRIQERSKFFSKLGDPHSGAQYQNAEQLWASYENEFPIASQDGKSVNTNNLNHWQLYTTPEAINSVRQTGDYVPAKVKGPDGSIIRLPMSGAQQLIQEHPDHKLVA